MSDKAGLLVVVNNSAARARRAWPVVREALERAGVGFDAGWMGAGVGRSASPAETEERVREGLRAGYATVAVVGGDGTLSAAASGFFERGEGLKEGDVPRAVNAEAALAVLPAGTGDDFARGLTEGRREPVERWIERLVRHCRRSVDEKSAVGNEVRTTRAADVLWSSADGGARRFVCLNASSLGVGAEVTARVAAQGQSLRLLPGEARFALAAVRPIAGWRNRRARVAFDGAGWEELRTNFVVVCNGAYAGGGMNFAPSARTDDGLLDVVVVSDISRAGVVREMSRIHRGGHVANPKVRIRRAARVRVESLDDELMIEADGDFRGRTPAEFVVMAAALRVVW